MLVMSKNLLNLFKRSDLCLTSIHVDSKTKIQLASEYLEDSTFLYYIIYRNIRMSTSFK